MEDVTTVRGRSRARRRDRAGRTGRLLSIGALAASIAVLASGCLFLPYASRNAAVQPQPRPWWCTSDVGSDLSLDDCRALSAQLDLALNAANSHGHASAAIAEGRSATAYAPGVGAEFAKAPTETFDPAAPDTLLYDGTDPTAQLVGLEWNVVGATPPAGFTGANDVWAELETHVWTLRVWIARPFENQVNVFAASHPCLGDGGAVYDVTAACYTQTHPRPLQILVSNDDGYSAPGINAVVQALIGVPGVEVTVVAPATNQSGVGDKTTPGGVTATSGQTASGYPATVVAGTPADSVNYALKQMGLNPDLVISGINEGQNMGPFVPLSGTIGAARTGARNGIPALAASQGFGSPPDFASGAAAVLAWLQDFRLGRAGAPYQTVANLNIPTCTTGSIRGTVSLPASTALNGRPYNPSNCTSTTTAFADDLDAFLNGYIALSDVGT